jgi:thiol-disulfide isomerase/thioredoxin
VPVGAQKLELRMAKWLTIRTGDLAPDFSVTTLEGKPLRLTDLRGKVVLVDFWATWCAPCVAEIPAIKKAYEAYGGAGRFEVVALSLDDDAEVVRRFAKAKGMSWPQAVAGPTPNPLAEKYAVSSIPATFLIGPDGRVVAKDLRGQALERELRKLLGAPREGSGGESRRRDRPATERPAEEL